MKFLNENQLQFMTRKKLIEYKLFVSFEIESIKNRKVDDNMDKLAKLVQLEEFRQHQQLIKEKLCILES